MTNGYPSGTVFRDSNLATIRQIEDFHMLPARPEIKNAGNWVLVPEYSAEGIRLPQPLP